MHAAANVIKMMDKLIYFVIVNSCKLMAIESLQFHNLHVPYFLWINMAEHSF